MTIAFEQPTLSEQPTGSPVRQAWTATELLRKVDNDIDLATELVEIFLEDAPEMSDDISVAVQHGDAAALASAAHAYKGSAAAIGAVAVARAAGALEASGRAGSTSVELEVAYFKELEVRLIDQLSAVATDS